MPDAEDWAEALPVDTSEAIYVANPAEGVHVFYTEEAEAFIRTDRVVDVSEHR